MSTVGNGLGASQDCLTYTASFNAAAQSRRDEAIDAIAPRATEKIAFGANPMNDSTVTLNGTAVTFAASPSAGQVQMGNTLAATLQNLIAALEAFADANIMLMEYFANASNLYVEALAGGAAGNAFTIAASTSPASGGTTSGTTLANGSLTELVTERGKELSWPSPRLSCTHCATSARCPSRKHSRYREKPRRRDALFLTLPAKPNEAIGQRRPAGVAKTAHADG